MGRAMAPRIAVTGFDEIVRSDPSVWEIQTAGDGPQGQLPLTAEMLLESPSGDLFGLTQNAGMGWDPRELGRPAVPDPQHAGRHSRAATARRSRSAITPATGKSACSCRRPREELRRARRRAVRRLRAPTRATAARRARRACSTACRTATTPRMVLRRLIRSLPTRRGVLGVATCDKGLPAMMMALAAHARPAVRARARRRDAAADARARTPARCRRSAPASRTARSRWRRRPSWAAAPAARPAAAASSSARRPRRRSSARRSGCRCRTPRSRRPGSRSGSTWPGARRAR